MVCPNVQLRIYQCAERELVLLSTEVVAKGVGNIKTRISWQLSYSQYAPLARIMFSSSCRKRQVVLAVLSFLCNVQCNPQKWQIKWQKFYWQLNWIFFLFRNTLGWVKVNLTACELSIVPTRLSPTISFLRNPETLQVLSMCWACCLTYCQQLPIITREVKLRASVFCPCLLHCCCFNKHWTMFCETCLASLLTCMDSMPFPHQSHGQGCCPQSSSGSDELGCKLCLL